MTNVDEKIETHSYPATSEELVDAYGETKLELPNGTETFGEALGRLEAATFIDAEDARLATYSVVSKGAIGRQNYSDRDSPSIGENGPELLSF